MAFKYINPGYGAWLNDGNVSTIENNFTYNPEHGISFKKCSSSSSDENAIPLPQAFTADIYARFNVYLGGSYQYDFFLGAKRSNSTSDYLSQSCIGIYINYYRAVLLAGYSINSTGGAIGNGLSNIKTNALNKIQFHIHRGEDAESSFGELTVNGETQTTQFSSNNYRQTFGDDKAFFIKFPTQDNGGDNLYISELIVSDREISPKEKIMRTQ